MSGFASICDNRDPRVSMPLLLDQMSRHLQIVGPDCQAIKQFDGIGLVHAMFRTTDEAKREQQPWSIDGETWIAADARVDARRELIAKLAGTARQIADDTPDCELILHAYQKWGLDCLQHLIGDFAFVIINVRTLSVFAARDAIGVRPLFYSQASDCLVVSSELDCVRMHPSVSNKLDDHFITDFLLFGSSNDPRATAFADIRRLAAGEAFTWRDGTFRCWRYWSPVVPPELRLNRLEDYEEGFRDVLEQAVSDRLRTPKISVSFSGGLDSTSVAAVALKCMTKTGGDLRGTSAVFDRVMPDRERYFATLAAVKLNMPINFVVADDLPLYDDNWDSRPTQMPEPTQRSYKLISEMNQLLGKHSRVVLSGNGGDEAINPATKYYQKLIKEFRWIQFSLDCSRHLRTLKTLPPIGLRTLLYKQFWNWWFKKDFPKPIFPKWLNPDIVKELNSKSRWQEIYHSVPNSREPRGKRFFENGWIAGSACFSRPIGLKHPLEYRYPYLDLRVIDYCWSIPPIPLRFAKQIIRRTMKEYLPEEVLRRPKQALAGEPLLCNRFQFPMPWREFVVRTPEVEKYVIGNPPMGSDEASPSRADVWRDTLPYELASWMHHRWKLG